MLIKKNVLLILSALMLMGREVSAVGLSDLIKKTTINPESLVQTRVRSLAHIKSKRATAAKGKKKAPKAHK